MAGGPGEIQHKGTFRTPQWPGFLVAFRLPGMNVPQENTLNTSETVDLGRPPARRVVEGRGGCPQDPPHLQSTLRRMNANRSHALQQWTMGLGERLTRVGAGGRFNGTRLAHTAELAV